MNKLDDKAWVAQYLTGRTWGWDELVRSGRAHLEELADGKLKTAITKWAQADAKVEELLEGYDYEAG